MKNNGGPAFPGIKYADEKGQTMVYMNEAGKPVPVILGDRPGMSLRDYFAAKAMQGFLSNANIKNSDKTISDENAIAKSSYIMADAMIAERGK